MGSKAVPDLRESVNLQKQLSIKDRNQRHLLDLEKWRQCFAMAKTRQQAEGNHLHLTHGTLPIKTRTRLWCNKTKTLKQYKTIWSHTFQCNFQLN
jgi:hypothetical protein